MKSKERENILSKLTPVFRDIFEDETIVISETTTSDDIEGWDSLEHINLMIEIEKIFAFRFSMEEVSVVKNVGEIIDIIQKKC